MFTGNCTCTYTCISYDVPLSLSVSLSPLPSFIYSPHPLYIYTLLSLHIYIYSPLHIYTLLSLPQPLSLSSSFPPLSRTCLSLSQICIKRWSVMVRIEPSTYGNYFNKMIITFYFSSLHSPSHFSFTLFLPLSLSSLSLPPNKDTFFKWFAKVSGCGQYHYNHALL